MTGGLSLVSIFVSTPLAVTIMFLYRYIIGFESLEHMMVIYLIVQVTVFVLTHVFLLVVVRRARKGYKKI